MKKLLLAAAIAAALTACGRHQDNASTTASSTTPSTSSSTDTSSSSTASTAGSTTSPADQSSGTTAAAPSNSDTTASASNTAVLGAGGDGATVYKNTCAMCHAAGVAGAPKLGDKADWGPRVAQGKDTLYKHAIGGFQGKKGAMPPKGGNTSLPDADVKAAVDYMTSQAK